MYVQTTWATTRAVCGLRISISNKLPGDIDAKPRLQWLVLNFMILEKLCGLLVNAQTTPQPRPCKSELWKLGPQQWFIPGWESELKDYPRVDNHPSTHMEAEPLLSASCRAPPGLPPGHWNFTTASESLLGATCRHWPTLLWMCESVNTPRQLEGTFLFVPTSWFPFSLLFPVRRELASFSGLVEQWFSAVGGFASQETLTKSGYVFDSPWFKTPAFSSLSSYGALSGPLLIQVTFSLWCHFISLSTLILKKVPPPTGLGSTYL